MKTFRLFSMAAVALVMASCSSEDSISQPEAAQQPGKLKFTATVAAPGGDVTRTTYTEVTSGDDAGKIKVAWKAGDQIDLYDENNSACTATVGSPAADGSATISGTITGSDGDDVSAYYPASVMTDWEAFYAKYNAQEGTLDYIQNNLDLRMGTGTLSVNGTEATLASPLKMVSMIAIWKLTLQDSSSQPLAATKVTVYLDGGDVASTTNISGTSTVYLALPLLGDESIFPDIPLTIDATVGSDTYTYSKSGVTLARGKYYQSTVTMEKQAAAPAGALSGQFTINSNGDKVYFSKGNLQYDGTNWKFADSQWEVLGANGTATGYPMDLFTWGNIDSPAYDGYPYVTGSANLSGDTDWGIRMGSGWRTLSGTAEGEWFYLFNTRTVNGGTGNGYCYTLGQSVNGKLGVVIYPDNYAGDLYTTGANWSTFEAAGCVFLPAAGYRYGASVSDVGNFGGYWSSTANSEYSAWFVDFDNMGNWNANDAGASYYGHSVRLVHDVAAPAPAPEEDFVTFTNGTNTVKVAKMNLGATSVAESPATCYGDYYAWGATETFGTVSYTAYNAGTVTATKTGGYSQNNAPFWNKDASVYTKYTSASDATLEAADDAVAANMPGWHMPTQAEFQTLYAACGGTGTSMTPSSISSGAAYAKGIYWVTGGDAEVTIGSDTYKVNGLLFVQDADTHVFFPAAGYVSGTDLKNAGSYGYYWSSSFDTSYAYADFAYILFFYSASVNPEAYSYRYYGYSVRPFKNAE